MGKSRSSTALLLSHTKMLFSTHITKAKTKLSVLKTVYKKTFNNLPPVFILCNLLTFCSFSHCPLWYCVSQSVQAVFFVTAWDLWHVILPLLLGLLLWVLTLPANLICCSCNIVSAAVPILSHQGQSQRSFIVFNNSKC